MKMPKNQSKVWCIVGVLRDHGHLTADMSPYDYVKLDESLIKFVFLKENMVRFVLGGADLEFNITFQSLAHSQSFYDKTYHNVNLSKAVSFIFFSARVLIRSLIIQYSLRIASC